jgi:nitrile hydratase
MHDHSNEDDHSRTFQPDHAEPNTDAALIGLALRELLIEQRVYTLDEEQAMIAQMQGASSENGAEITARAWMDDAFKKRLLENSAETIKELGHDMSPLEFTVLENTDTVHNVIVCTLCSCYPRTLLGMSPAWYKTPSWPSILRM